MTKQQQNERLSRQDQPLGSVNKLETELLAELDRLYKAAHEPVDYKVLWKVSSLASLALVLADCNE